MTVTPSDFLPIVTAVLAALPVTIGAILVTRSKHKEEESSFRKDLLRETQSELERIRERVDELVEERQIDERKIAFLINQLAVRGLFGEIADELERFETTDRKAGKRGRDRGRDWGKPDGTGHPRPLRT